MAYNQKTGMYEGFIYKIYNDINDKIYIGQTINSISKRFSAHISDAKSGNSDMAIHNAMNKYGYDNFHIQEIIRLQNENLNILKEELSKLEIMYIDMYDSASNQGYNISQGGGIVNHSMKKVKKYSADGELLCLYNSLVEASNCMQCGQTTIAEACKGIKPSYLGYVWRYEDDDFFKYLLDNDYLQKELSKKKQIDFSKGRFVSKKVNCYKENIFIKTFDSIQEAANEVGLKNGYNITNVCQGRRNYAGGYKWFYSNDLNQPDKTKIII